MLHDGEVGDVRCDHVMSGMLAPGGAPCALVQLGLLVSLAIVSDISYPCIDRLFHSSNEQCGDNVC